MALARSASGPGGLSINTSSANTLFGTSSSQAPAAGGLFGSASQTQTTQPAAGTSLFGNAASTTPKTGGLFGNTGTTAAAQPQSTGTSGIFGSAGTTVAGGGGGLFGSAASSQPQQQTSGGLFGSANNNAAQPAQQQTTSGMFGGATQNQSQTQGGGLFGGSLLSKPQQATNTSTLFGQSTQPKAGGLLYVEDRLHPTLDQLNTNRDSGQSQMNPGQSVLGPGLTMGQSTNQQTVPGIRIDVTNLRGTTRFNDLQEMLQKEILQLDTIIQGYMSQKSELDAFIPAHGEMLSNIPNDVKFVERKYGGVENALRSDAEAIEVVNGLVKQDANNARLSFRAIDNLRLPQQYHTTGLWSSRQGASSTANTETDGQDLVSFFSKTSDEMDEQLKRYQKNLSDIESHMHGVQDGLVGEMQKMMAAKNGGASGTDQKLAELGAVLRDFERSILQVAHEVGGAREGMARLQLGEFINNGADRNGLF
ncbi:uncharacterized protein BCR38DRAFT_445202 [Pseudomassariella vexata]|uniref:Nucleoporin NUP49/NSP49 n=1 Tax=Pseudomassariella vexata TaxID=1141098 RepID=A0A1Y2DK70_9PEZI|nr:uncharacterized protein BCR38DRAFT_445202 [Pseudomassariella vexata]ORY59678.1 hypothetical protein BCR38DRAFT_445202 [Pseudomassariella vexata]